MREPCGVTTRLRARRWWRLKPRWTGTQRAARVLLRRCPSPRARDDVAGALVGEDVPVDQSQRAGLFHFWFQCGAAQKPV